jgi:hypothetical protein
VAQITPAERSQSADTEEPESLAEPEAAEAAAGSGEELEDLAEDLFIGEGGGDGGFCGGAPEGVELPAVEARTLFHHNGYVCLWGFPVGESVLIVV